MTFLIFGLADLVHFLFGGRERPSDMRRADEGSMIVSIHVKALD